MLISRGYVTGRAALARALAATAAAALIAGCGGSGGSPTPPATTPATPTPVVSGSGAGVQDQAGGGSSGTGSAAAGKLSTAATGSISHASPGSYSKAPSPQVNQGSQGSAVMTPAQAKAAENLANKLNNLINQSATNTPPPLTTTTRHSTTTAPPTQAATPPKTRVVVVIRTKIHTVYVNRTTTKTVAKTVPKTVTKTVTKTVAPKVPTGAFLPSKHPELGQQSFTITGSNLGCTINQTGVRCGIKNRSWTPPVQPSSCKSTWGDTIALASKGLPTFACGGNSPIQVGAKVVPSGWDDKVGNYICQVRSFDVNCFNSTSNSGFMISRTGYSVY